MPKLKAGHISPTPEEDAAITAAAMADPDAQPFTDEEWAQALPTVRRGRPPVAIKRPMLSMRTDPDVLAYLRASGPGWQTRVNRLLREAMAHGRV